MTIRISQPRYGTPFDGLLFVGPWTPQGVGSSGIGSPAAPTGAAWATANKLNYYPLRLSNSFWIKNFYIANGATVNGNLQMGLYDAAFNLVCKCNILAQAGASVVQRPNISPDVVIGPGLYYLGVWSSSTTATFMSASIGPQTGSFFGFATETGLTGGLPNTGTPLTWASHFMPVCGINGRFMETDSPTRLPPLVTINPWSFESIGPAMYQGNSPMGGAASAVWPVANKALAFPFSIYDLVIIKKVWWFNGSVVSGTVALTIYDHLNYTKKFGTGAVTQAGTSTVQSVDIADFTLGPGNYWMVLSCSNVTATFFRVAPANAQVVAAYGALEQTSAHPPPDPLVPVDLTSAYVPIFGLTTRTLI